MNLLLFCTAFILQSMGHKVGDYLIQTHSQALNKSKKISFRLRHCIMYSLSVSLMMLFAFDIMVVSIVLIFTLLEHMWIDSRKPVIAWKTFLEKRIAKNKEFNVDELPFFVVIEIDQTVHYLRLFIIALLIGYEVI